MFQVFVCVLIFVCWLTVFINQSSVGDNIFPKYQISFEVNENGQCYKGQRINVKNTELTECVVVCCLWFDQYGDSQHCCPPRLR